MRAPRPYFARAWPTGATTSEAGCTFPWVNYCQSVHAATRYALERGKAVAIVAQPKKIGDGADRHREQQRALADMINRHFANHPRVRYVDFSDTIDLRDSDLAFDGMHLGADGNAIIAKALVAPVRLLAGAL